MQTKHKAAPPRADIITQRELQEILGRHNKLIHDALEIRCRLEAGAAIQPGHYTAKSDGEINPIDSWEESANSIDIAGLEITPSDLSSDARTKAKAATRAVITQEAN